MNRKPTTNRQLVIASAVAGVVLFGAAGFAAAAKGDSHPARVPATVNSIDDKGGLTGGHGADDATSTSNSVTVSSVDDHGTDTSVEATENSTDDNGTDTSVEATENSVDDHGGLVGGHGADDATENSVDDNGGLVGGHGADDATSTSVDDNGTDVTTGSTVTTVDDHGGRNGGDDSGKGGHGSDD